MQEIWKFYMEVKSDSYKGIYEVSNYGNVKFNGCSYVCNVHKGYKYLSHKLLHRIVAELFIPNPDNKPCVDHIDTNRLNNRVDNLRWVTRKENNNNPLSIQHYRESASTKPVTPPKPVLQYTKDNIFVTEFKSITEAEIQTKIAKSSITLCCKQKRKSAGGYIWKYKED